MCVFGINLHRLHTNTADYINTMVLIRLWSVLWKLTQSVEGEICWNVNQVWNICEKNNRLSLLSEDTSRRASFYFFYQGMFSEFF